MAVNENYIRDVKAGLIKILESPSEDVSELKEKQKNYKAFLDSVINSGMERKQYFHIIQELINLFDKKEECKIVDELYEMETSIIGHSSEFYIPRFNNEPLDHREFIMFVRGEKWK